MQSNWSMPIWAMLENDLVMAFTDRSLTQKAWSNSLTRWPLNAGKDAKSQTFLTAIRV
jgi:hypothetical protein